MMPLFVSLKCNTFLLGYQLAGHWQVEITASDAMSLIELLFLSSEAQ